MQPLIHNWNHSSPSMSVLQKYFKSYSSFTGWIAMNQKLYWQSEPSSLSCALLNNNEQHCVWPANLQQEFAQGLYRNKSLLSCACWLSGTCNGSQLGSLGPSRKDTRVPPLPDPGWPITLTSKISQHGNTIIAKGFETSWQARYR